ncbi:DUF998 domain-containing protein [Streptomyces sp. NPDC002855]|uniref:DUF998 domain-containing protein n=1 Tax=Streptomyces sp. NPDC002855 TaxID=3154437 RepID=UPI00332552B7
MEIERTKREKLTARIGCVAWIVGVVQFFVIHGIAQSAWAKPYSWARFNISDLGNAHCALQAEPEPRYVCSPEHDLMNAAFIVLGALLVVGVILTGASLWRRGFVAITARVLLAGAGVGFVMAGLAPADVNENQHVLGALLIMALGNIGLFLAGLGSSAAVPRVLRRATSVLGLVALVALGLFLSHQYLGLGMGGMERVAAFPILAWALAVGTLGLIRPTSSTPSTPTRHALAARSPALSSAE